MLDNFEAGESFFSNDGLNEADWVVLNSQTPQFEETSNLQSCSEVFPLAISELNQRQESSLTLDTDTLRNYFKNYLGPQDQEVPQNEDMLDSNYLFAQCDQSQTVFNCEESENPSKNSQVEVSGGGDNTWLNQVQSAETSDSDVTLEHLDWNNFLESFSNFQEEDRLPCHENQTALSMKQSQMSQFNQEQNNADGTNRIKHPDTDIASPSSKSSKSGTRKGIARDDYTEIQRLYSTMLSDEQLYDLKGDIVNFIFDNADINVRTLTGHGTCHVMSGIACVTPTGEETAQRSTQRVERSIVPYLKGQFGHVLIKMYNKSNTTGFKSITIRPFKPPKKQLRRARQKPSSDILFELTMKTTTSKQAFLSNAKNTDRLIKNLMEKLGRNPLQLARSTGRLWQFLRDCLHNPEYNPSIIKWENIQRGEFRIVQTFLLAKRWGSRNGNKNMSYEYMSRAMRYNYKPKYLMPVHEKRLVYKFGPASSGWQPAGTIS
ncbi:ETS-related transcription factor Elf-3 [Nymphon striatum]|nr:ETS-related transcription factor Elf-3 [Nymphon striatum]